MAENGANGGEKGERNNTSKGLRMGQITTWFAHLARIIKAFGKSYAQGARQTERSDRLAWRKLTRAHMYVHTKDAQLNLFQVYAN